MKKLLILFLLLFLSFFSLFCQIIENDLALERKQIADILFKENEVLYSSIKAAFLSVDKVNYIDYDYVSAAYNNQPIPSGNGLIQPASEMISLILKEALISQEDKVLLIGKNSAYINEIISILTPRFYVNDPGISATSEISYNLKNNFSYYSWIDDSPFDVIILFGSLDEIPQSLISQLKSSGKLIFPFAMNSGNQILTSIRKSGNSFNLKALGSSYIHSLK